MQALGIPSPLSAYARQAEALLAGWNAGDADARNVVCHHLPRLLDHDVGWLPTALSEAELRAERLDTSDARLAVARWYDFRDWRSLEEWVSDVNRPGSRIARFEQAVEAVVGGDANGLQRLLDADSRLVRARSSIATPHQPPRHCATLLHYVAANGVEGYRQRTPANAVEIADIVLRAGADPDAVANMYGGQATPLSMLVSSAHPAHAGLQASLAEKLLDYGAAVDGRGSGNWVSPLLTALAFGYLETAETLVRRGARVDTLHAAAGLGVLTEVRKRLPAADPLSRHRALALAAQHGHVQVLRALLDAGEDPNRLNPEGNHQHSTPLHQAALAGHLEAVQLLVERGARLDAQDTIWHGTPLGWAEHGHRADVAEYLRGLTHSRPAS
jgi:ankyrin repeat protein